VAEVIFDLAVAELKRLDGLGAAHRDDPAAFDFLHSLLREPLVGRLRELPGQAACAGRAPSRYLRLYLS
jgi:hypothetical protein